MKQIKVQPLSREEFAPFGEYYTMTEPTGYPLCGAIHKFYPDRLTTTCQGRLAFSPLVVRKPEKMIITQQEYHTSTEELLMPLDDDMILHVAPASAGAVVTDYVKVFDAGKSISMVVYINTKVDIPSADVEVLYVIRDSQGNALPELCISQSMDWQKMWNNRYFYLTIPNAPEASGSYTMELYFNGESVLKKPFSVK